MRRIVILLIIFIAYSYAKINIGSFHSKFIQTITNEQNKTIRYEGELWFKKPLLVKWLYTKPNYKEIYVIANKVTIVEPELEQITIKKLDKDIDIFQILHNAKQIAKNHFIATSQHTTFHLFLDNNRLKKITFVDKLGNHNEIIFTNPEQNREINTTIFQIPFNEDWDIIQE